MAKGRYPRQVARPHRMSRGALTKRSRGQSEEYKPSASPGVRTAAGRGRVKLAGVVRAVSLGHPG